MSKTSDRKFTVFTRFYPPQSPTLDCKDASLTRQEFVQEADINNIMRRYASGLPPAPGGARTPYFGDFSNIPDYQTSLNQVIDAQDKFMQLPSALRKRFDNDPGKLLDFLADDKNREEAVKLGLVNAPASAPASASVEKSVEKSVESKSVEKSVESQSPKGAE